MYTQQKAYFIFLAACFISISILQEYRAKEKKFLHNKNIFYYIWYRSLLILKISFFFWAVVYGQSKVFLDDPLLATIYVASDLLFLHRDHPFLFVLVLIFAILYFRVIYYLAENYHHSNLFFLYSAIFFFIYILENYLILK